jgi:uncharacterized protein YndB with AHSA1/START domain
VAAANGWNAASGLSAGILTINTAIPGNQTPVADDYTIGNLTQTAGSVTAVTITPKTGKSPGTVTIYYEGTGTTTYAKNTSVPTAAGTYAVTFDVAAASGWNAASGLSAGTLTINSQNQTPVSADYTIGNLNQTAGSVTAVTITPKSGKSTGTVTIYYEGTGTTTYAKNSTPPTAAGTYAVTFNVAAASGWNAANGLSAGTLTIDARTVAGIAITLQPTKRTYNHGDTLDLAGLMVQVYYEIGSPENVSYSNFAAKNISASPAHGDTLSVAAHNSRPVTITCGGQTAATSALTVNRINPIIDDFTVSGTGTCTYDGSPKAVTVTAKSGKTTVTVTVKYNGSATVPVNAGTYTVTFDAVADTNYNAASGLSAGTLTINKATPVAGDFTISGLTQTYDGSPKAVTVTVKSGKTTGTVTVKYNSSTTAPSNAGTYTVTFDAAADSNYNVASGLTAGTLTINKAVGASVGAPTLNTKTYNSITINPVTASSGQSVEYAISASSAAPSSGWQAGVTFNGLNEGTTYYIFAHAAGNDNYNTGTASNSLSVTTMVNISEKKIEYYWIDRHDSLVTTSGGSVTAAAGSTLTITAQGTGYVVKHWYLDGLDTGESGNTYSFSSITTGKHTVSLFVEKSGKLYNTNITVTVQ